MRPHHHTARWRRTPPSQPLWPLGPQWADRSTPVLLPPHLPGACTPPEPSPGRAFRRQLSACSLRSASEGGSAAAGALPAGPVLGAPGASRNLSRACCVLEADGVQAGASTGSADAGPALTSARGADAGEAAPPRCVAGSGSGARGVTAGRGLTACASCAAGDHPAGELLATDVLALPPTGPAEALGPAGLPEGVWEEGVPRGAAAVDTKPLAVALPTPGSRAAGRASGRASLHPWAVCEALGGWGSVGPAPGCLGGRPGNMGLAGVAVGWWLEQTKTPASAVGR